MTATWSGASCSSCAGGQLDLAVQARPQPPGRHGRGDQHTPPIGGVGHAIGVAAALQAVEHRGDRPGVRPLPSASSPAVTRPRRYRIPRQRRSVRLSPTAPPPLRRAGRPRGAARRARPLRRRSVCWCHLPCRRLAAGGTGDAFGRSSRKDCFLVKEYITHIPFDNRKIVELDCFPWTCLCDALRGADQRSTDKGGRR